MAATKDSALHSLPVILARFSEARCVLECGLQCLEHHSDATREAVCLRQGLELLASVYEDLDMAIVRAKL